MIDASYCTAMAEYNRWMNARLYAACSSISDSERKEDKAAFFGSVHRTLNHILYGDLAFMSRFTGNPSVVPELGVDLHDDFQELWVARAALDKRILDWAGILSEEWLGDELTYESKVDGITRTQNCSPMDSRDAHVQSRNASSWASNHAAISNGHRYWNH